MRIAVALVLGWMICVPPAASAAELSAAVADSTTAPKPDAILTLAEVVGLNTLIWSYDRYIRDEGMNPGFRIGFNSIEDNIKNGFEWDDNNFNTNQFAHPFHGSLYFNTARSNGFDFWEAMPFTFLGSFLWEYVYEVHHPSINDWVVTSVGGIALGEATRRMSTLVLTTGSGQPGFWNELGAFFVNPMRGFNRLFFPREDQNQFESRPEALSTYLEYGVRTLGEGDLLDAAPARGFLHYGFRYGDPFAEDCELPFDFFHFDIQMNFADSNFLGGVAASGLLARHVMTDSDDTQHLLAGMLNYQYFENEAYQFGGQSIGADLFSRYRLSETFSLHTKAAANVLVMGATTSDYVNFSGREYDYGPGLGLDLGGQLLYRGREFVSLRHVGYWLHSLNGNEGNHLVSATSFGLRVPLNDRYDVGLLYLLYLADRRYADYPTAHARYPEIRLNVRVNYF